MNTWWFARRLPISVAIVAAGCLLAQACGSGGPAANITPTETLIHPSGLTATGTPVYEGSIDIGDWVGVTGVAGCLDMRLSAGSETDGPINFCQPNGYQGYTSDGPFYSDGQWWWWIAGQGWADERNLKFLEKEDLSRRVVPHLSGLGQIAYVGPDGDLWLMNADGSSRIRLVDAEHNATPSDSFGIGVPQWRPDGRQLLFGVYSRGSSGDKFSVRIVEANGDLVTEVPDATSAFWSPDGTRLGLLHGITSTGLGVLEATPSVMDIATSALTPIGPHLFYVEGPKWQPNGEELVYMNEQGLALAQADGSGSRILLPTSTRGGFAPNWSPDGTKLSLQGYSLGCQGYAVYDVETESVRLCASVRPGDPNRGGRDGTSEDGQTDWSPDGRLFAYHTEWGVVNESGIYVVDATTGEQTLIPAWSSWYTGFAPDSRHVVLNTYGGFRSFIWIGDAVTGEVTLLGEGSQPAWRPVVQ